MAGAEVPRPHTQTPAARWAPLFPLGCSAPGQRLGVWPAPLLKVASEVLEAEWREVGTDPLADPPLGVRSVHAARPAELVLEVLGADPPGGGEGSQARPGRGRAGEGRGIPGRGPALEGVVGQQGGGLGVVEQQLARQVQDPLVLLVGLGRGALGQPGPALHPRPRPPPAALLLAPSKSTWSRGPRLQLWGLLEQGPACRSWPGASLSEAAALAPLALAVTCWVQSGGDPGPQIHRLPCILRGF